MPLGSLREAGRTGFCLLLGFLLVGAAWSQPGVGTRVLDPRARTPARGPGGAAIGLTHGAAPPGEDLLEAVFASERARRDALAAVRARGDLPEPFREVLVRILEDLRYLHEEDGLLRMFAESALHDEARLCFRLLKDWAVDTGEVAGGEGGFDPGAYPFPRVEDVSAWLAVSAEIFGGGGGAAGRFEVVLFLERVGWMDALFGASLIQDFEGLLHRAGQTMGGTIMASERAFAPPSVGRPIHPLLMQLGDAMAEGGLPTRLEQARVSPGGLEVLPTGVPPSLLRVALGLGLEAGKPVPPGRPASPGAPIVRPDRRARDLPGPDRRPPPVPWIAAVLAALVLGGLALRAQSKARRAESALRELEASTGGGKRTSAPGSRERAEDPMDTSPGPGGGAPSRWDDADVPNWLLGVLHASTADRYAPVTVLGSGGMGTVVLARDERLGRDVAIKVPPPHMVGSDVYRERFLREAQALARLGHENIAAVYDVPDVPAGELPIMVMEYLRGEDLLAVLEREGPTPLPRLVDWIAQAAEGLQTAHDEGILHRDVKPANLMLVNESRVKVLDFGLAALDDAPTLTRSGALMGSVAYMPPEQLRGERVHAAADQYALAASAFQLLTGKLPFDAGDALRKTPPRLCDHLPTSPPGIGEVLRKGLAPYPEDRHASIREFAAALRGASGGEARPGA